MRRTAHGDAYPEKQPRFGRDVRAEVTDDTGSGQCAVDAQKRRQLDNLIIEGRLSVGPAHRHCSTSSHLHSPEISINKVHQRWHRRSRVLNARKLEIRMGRFGKVLARCESDGLPTSEQSADRIESPCSLFSSKCSASGLQFVRSELLE